MNAERKFLFACLIFALVIYAIHAFGLFDLLTDLPHLQTLIRQSGLFGYSLYILLFIIATLFVLPGSILVIAGGIVFGPLLGTLPPRWPPRAHSCWRGGWDVIYC